MPLGLFPGMLYEERTLTITPGETLLFYSDGLVEAHNSTREMFGVPRLTHLLAQDIRWTSLIDFLLESLKNFTSQENEQEDDVTLVTLHRSSLSLTKEQELSIMPTCLQNGPWQASPATNARPWNTSPTLYSLYTSQKHNSPISAPP